MTLRPGSWVTGSLDSYHIERQLSSGGMGVVHYCTTRGGQPVVVKEPFLDDPVKLQKLRVEGLILKQLKHPSIVGYIDERDEVSNYYLVIDYIDGKTLREKYHRTPADEQQVKRIAEHVLDPLKTIHQNNIIHRDINPKNILLNGSGEVKLIDFGAAKHGYNQIDPSSNTVIGTPGYGAPEQFAGFATPQTDIYGLGATMFFLLTGDGPNVYQNSPTDVPDPKRANPTVTSQLRDVVMKAMQPEPARRHKTADEMLSELKGTYRPSYVPRLIIAGKSFPIKGAVTIGREPSSNIYVEDPGKFISRNHARIYQDSGDYWIEDMGSTNGTYILKKAGIWDRVYKYRLEPNDTIAFCYKVGRGAWITGTFATN